MNKSKIIILLILVTAGACLLYNFTQKHYVEIIDEKELDITVEYHPQFFSMIHSQEKVELWEKAYPDSRELADMKWDFNRYSYVISKGRRVKAMYYSDKSTLIDDESPYYCRVWKDGKKLLRLVYADSITNTAIIYTIPKDTLISGIQGC